MCVYLRTNQCNCFHVTMEPSVSRFTPAEGGARLAATARVQNTLVTEHTSFIATRLLHEEAYQIRGSLSSGKKRSLYITLDSRVEYVSYSLNVLTDLLSVWVKGVEEVQDDIVEDNQVLVCTSAVSRHLFEKQLLRMCNVNVIIIDSCHLISHDECLRYLMSIYKQTEETLRPRILALTYPLFNLAKKSTNQEENVKTEPKTTDYDVKNENEDAKNGSVTNAVNENAILDEKSKVDDILTAKEPDDNPTDVIVTETSKNENAENDDAKFESKDDTTVELSKETPKCDTNKDQFAIGEYENLDDFDMYEKIEWKIDVLESELCCKADLAEDIDGVKRLSMAVAKPKELIIEYRAEHDTAALQESYIELDKYMRETVKEALDFFEEHRYDPTEIYGEDMYEEIKLIPDPTVEPKEIMYQFLYILEQLGPYGADKAAFSLLAKLEKLKVKVPYERHFLLLCVCTSVFVKIRAYADLIFSKFNSEWDMIQNCCSPKILRFVEILEQFKPPNSDKNESVNAKNGNENAKNGHDANDKETGERNDSKGKFKEKLLNQIESCDFSSLGDKIEDKIHTLEANLKELDDTTTSSQNKNESAKNGNENAKNENENAKDENPNEPNLSGFPKRVGFKTRVRGRVPRSVNRIQQLLLNPDALCGIVFVKEPLMAKILFMIIVDLYRTHPALNFICAQYCYADRPTDPRTEQKESEKQRRKQEDVLKKFRMHECNLLLATSLLEEGIDLPRCNLVLRWDIPINYRSYGLCRGRARAVRSTCVVMTSHSGDMTSSTGQVATPTEYMTHNLATYKELDQIVSRKCGCGASEEPPQSEEIDADIYTNIVHPYTPNERNGEETESGVKKTESGVKKTESGVKKTESGVKKTESGVKKTESGVGKTESEVKKTESGDGKNSSKTNVSEVKNSNNQSSVKIVNANKNTKSKTSVKRKDFSEISEKSSEISVKSSEISEKSSEISVSKTSKSEVLSENVASVDLSTAVALINRYCGKLPSDTFTRLAPQYWMEEVHLPLIDNPGATGKAYICTLRLPLNCPVKYNIVGHPMPTRVLARRMVALQACRILHKSGELDNQLMPIGKENFKAADLNEKLPIESEIARPGSTKRRQYYYKRTARAFTNCEPIVDSTDADIENNPTFDPAAQQPKTGRRNMLFLLSSRLCCGLPERYNTRGRRLHQPQQAQQALAILMATDKEDTLSIPSFPVYTRSGEVRVCVRHVPHADVRVSPNRGKLVRRFMRFVFAEVLRVRRRGMTLQSEGSTHNNNYYIVPTIKTTKPDGSAKINVDWAFLELIYQYTEEKKHSDIEKPILWHQDEEELENDMKQSKQGVQYKAEPNISDAGNEVSIQSNLNQSNGDNVNNQSTQDNTKNKEIQPKIEAPVTKFGYRKTKPVTKMANPLLKPGEVFVFDAEKYKEAVVTPWYRNQDQPQFFLVAEICWNLSPESAFPSEIHSTFRNYYKTKYGVELTQPDQPLLDVDHTSARLNLLTPRYVNRKGVALPVSSERTRRAKRDRLDQKQILVPELCRVHPFAAPLWFATVALPCVLYRINGLLIADEIRRGVGCGVGLGMSHLPHDHHVWPPLDFGWSLAQVLSADSEKNEKKKDESVEEVMSVKGREWGETVEIKTEDTIKPDEEVREKTINEILQEKEANMGFEIGTWSNDMASSIPEADFDDYMEPLPPNLTFCTSASGGTNWCDPVPTRTSYNPKNYEMADSDCSFMSSDFDTDDTESGSDGDTDSSGFWSENRSNAAMGVRIEYKTAHEAEAVDLDVQGPNPTKFELDVDLQDLERHAHFVTGGEVPQQYKETFHRNVERHKTEIKEKGLIINQNDPVKNILPETQTSKPMTIEKNHQKQLLRNLFPYGKEENEFKTEITIDEIEKNKRRLLELIKKMQPESEIKKMNCFSMIDVDIDSNCYVNEKLAHVGFDKAEDYKDKNLNKPSSYNKSYMEGHKSGKDFDFDYQPKLEGHPGPSPSIILQALTMSNANDGINLERLETIGDSFLKFAITAYLYCAHPTVHEGKLSHMRSKQVSNLNLYRLGRYRRLGARMIASKFEPHDNWLPPCHTPPDTVHIRGQYETTESKKGENPNQGCFIPYNLITEHSIPDKSIADCVEALIGAYLIETGPRGALLFMSWLGIRVLPLHHVLMEGEDQRTHGTAVDKNLSRSPTPESDSECDSSDEDSTDEFSVEHHSGYGVGVLEPYCKDGKWYQPVYGELIAPPSPLLRFIEDPEGELEQMLSGYDALERTLQYRFKDRSLLLQALTHASHQQNRLTDCYQRLEFLGDAILDYLITRHLYEDPRRHSPGALTDLRSALVNNTIFATLAVRHQLHKYFRHMSPGLNEVLTKYVKIQEDNGHSISEEHYLIQEDEMEQAEDVEVPKALGDLFESVAGAIFLDSGMSLGAVWRSYLNLMGAELEAFSAAAPKSPVRELLEAEPDTAKFGKPERLADGRRVRVCVEVFGRGTFKGIGRNYRIAKGTAARCALRHLKKHRAY